MNNEEHEKRHRQNCGKLYCHLLNDCDLILDDGKDFKMKGVNVMRNRLFYSAGPGKALADVKFHKKKKFE